MWNLIFIAFCLLTTVLVGFWSTFVGDGRTSPLKYHWEDTIAVRRGLKSKCIPLDSKTNPHFTKVTSHGHLLLKKTKSVTSHINRCNLKDCNFVIWQLKTRSRFECWFQEDGGNFLIEGINNFQRYFITGRPNIGLHKWLTLKWETTFARCGLVWAGHNSIVVK